MKHQAATLQKLEQMESNLSKIHLHLNRGNRDECYLIIDSLKEQIEQIKSYVENESQQ